MASPNMASPDIVNPDTEKFYSIKRYALTSQGSSYSLVVFNDVTD